MTLLLLVFKHFFIIPLQPMHDFKATYPDERCLRKYSNSRFIVKFPIEVFKTNIVCIITVNNYSRTFAKTAWDGATALPDRMPTSVEETLM